MHADHDHEHPHEHLPDSDGSSTYYQRLEAAVRELLITKDIITGDDVRQVVEEIDFRTPALGAKVVARAWVDPAYKERLLADGTAAVEELGIPMGGTQLVVVENTPEAHNVIVCTLCSCYPRTVLGLSPDWYKSKTYRARVVRDPRSVLTEFGTTVPDNVAVRVHDSTADMRYLVLPMRPDGTEELSETELAALVTRDSMIGVARARRPERDAVAPRGY
jgi:nitrile hydratase